MLETAFLFIGIALIMVFCTRLTYFAAACFFAGYLLLPQPFYLLVALGILAVVGLLAVVFDYPPGHDPRNRKNARHAYLSVAVSWLGWSALGIAFANVGNIYAQVFLTALLLVALAITAINSFTLDFNAGYIK